MELSIFYIFLLEQKASSSSKIKRNSQKKREKNRIKILKWSGRVDLNHRPSEPHSDTLPDCATPRHIKYCKVLRSLPPSQNHVKNKQNSSKNLSDRLNKRPAAEHLNQFTKKVYREGLSGNQQPRSKQRRINTRPAKAGLKILTVIVDMIIKLRHL